MQRYCSLITCLLGAESKHKLRLCRFDMDIQLSFHERLEMGRRQERCVLCVNHAGAVIWDVSLTDNPMTFSQPCSHPFQGPLWCWLPQSPTLNDTFMIPCSSTLLVAAVVLGATSILALVYEGA